MQGYVCATSLKSDAVMASVANIDMLMLRFSSTIKSKLVVDLKIQIRRNLFSGKSENSD